MYIFKNAVKSITRNKLRNILIGIIVLIISTAACVSLSIRQAAEAAREDTMSNLSVTAQITFDRQKAMEEMRNDAEGGADAANTEDKTPDRSAFDFDVLQGSSLTLDDYLTYAKAQRTGDSYYYSGAFSLDATGDVLPYGTAEEDSASESEPAFGNMPEDMGGKANMGGAMGGKAFQVNQGDFSVTGYSSYEAMLSMFGGDGSYSITAGEMFDEESDALECVISNELAGYNGLEAGDTLKLANPQCADETYKLKIVGIYTNSDSSSQENNRFSINDPANNIYMSYNALQNILSASQKADNVSDDEETSAVLFENLAFTYTFASVENYEHFAKKVYDLGLTDDYIVSSGDLQAYENSLAPLDTLSNTAMWFFIIVLGAGGVILVTLNIFNLRERKYEVGVLTAIGMRKSRVALQFVTEIFIVTFSAIIIGAGVGAAASAPVTNTLLQSQIQSVQENGDAVNENFGFKQGPDMKADKLDRFAGSPAVEYVDSVSGGTNIFVILQLVCVGLFLTVVSSLAALISIMRYEPLKILSNRS